MVFLRLKRVCPMGADREQELEQELVGGLAVRIIYPA
jgi:hypothetical protein